MSRRTGLRPDAAGDDWGDEHDRRGRRNPVRVGYQAADLVGGLYLAPSAVAVMLKAQIAGAAEYVQVSLFDSQMHRRTVRAGDRHLRPGGGALRICDDSVTARVAGFHVRQTDVDNVHID